MTPQRSGAIPLIDLDTGCILSPSMASKAKAQHDHVHRTHPAVVKRLARIAGHIQGIARMIEAKKSCPEVLQQMAAVMAALDSTRKVFLEDHIKGCIVQAVRDRKADEAVEEIERVLALIA